MAEHAPLEKPKEAAGHSESDNAEDNESLLQSAASAYEKGKKQFEEKYNDIFHHTSAFIKQKFDDANHKRQVAQDEALKKVDDLYKQAHDKAEQVFEHAKQMAKEVYDQMMERAKKIYDDAKGRMFKVKEQRDMVMTEAEKNFETAKEKAKELYEVALQKAKESYELAKEKAEQMREQSKTWVQKVYGGETSTDKPSAEPTQAELSEKLENTQLGDKDQQDVAKPTANPENVATSETYAQVVSHHLNDNQ